MNEALARDAALVLRAALGGSPPASRQAAVRLAVALRVAGATDCPTPQQVHHDWPVSDPETDDRFLVATIKDGELVCPYCGTVDSVVEEDVAHRWNTIDATDEGFLFAGLGETNFIRRAFSCTHCFSNVSLPGPIEDHC